ncbi:MAG: amidohydrolase family protein [Clostridiales bacterium]|nr:amidohydrolase family protein [Clostridiales bacterium]
MFIIDFHTHCFPDAIAGRAMSLLAAESGLPFFHDGTAAGLDENARAEGCGGYVVLPIATNPRQTASVNRFAAGIQDPARHIYSFGSVHPENGDFREHLRAVKEMGLFGVKLHPEYQSFHVNDEKIFPLYEEIFRHGLPLLFHAGEDEGFSAPWHAEPYKIAEVARRYPEAVIIAAHLGGYRRWREAADCLSQLGNVYMDVSFSAGRMPDEDFQEACSRWPSERILFATDNPWQSVTAAIEAVKRLPCSEREKELIFSGNALRVLRVS